MTEPTIAQLRREARALVNEANMPVGLGAVLRLFALKLDSISDGERHRCGHLTESHGKFGCELCPTCQYVPVRELASLEEHGQQLARNTFTCRICHLTRLAADNQNGACYQCRLDGGWYMGQDETINRQDLALTRPQGHSANAAPLPVVD